MLQVKTVDVTDQVCKRIGIKQPSVRELIKLTKYKDYMWDKVYAQGNTVVINQCEQIPAIKKLKVYEPKNIEELTAFVAAIRPSFQSMIDVFLNRKNFEYEIPAFDKICQGRFQNSSFLLK